MDIHFSDSSTADAGAFKLLEINTELAGLLENPELRWTIKGVPDEDAVLCTADKTYGMRAVNLSNVVLVVRPGPQDTAHIADQLHEIIELAPIVPRLYKLRGRVYDDEERDDDDETPRLMYAQARQEIQASDAELATGLRERRILVIDDELRPIAQDYLARVIELILNILVSHSLSPKDASVETLLTALADEHEVGRSISEQIMGWFGTIAHGKWTVNIDAIVREVGLAILRPHRHEPITKDALFAKWKESVGDAFEHAVSLSLLQGNYIPIDATETAFKYFPASDLPVDPAARFSDLFLTRTRWKGEELAPFLTDIAVDSKERDKLLLKYCRAVNDGQGIRYTARAQYNG